MVMRNRLKGMGRKSHEKKKRLESLHTAGKQEDEKRKKKSC